MSYLQKKIFLNISIILIIGNYVYFLFFKPDIQGYFYTIVNASIFYLILGSIISRAEISFTKIIQIIFLILFLKIIAIFYLPIGSDDYFRYLWDGKVLANGINPFQYVPNSLELSYLHSKILPKMVTYPNLPTIYFPISQFAFYLAFVIGGEKIIGLKIILLISDILLTIGLFNILKKRNIEYKFILLYILCPLIFYQFFIDAHIDLIGIMFFVFTIYFFENKKILAAIFLGASLAVKPTFLLVLPILFFYDKEFKDKIKWIIIPILFLIISFLPFLIGANPFISLLNFSRHWNFNGAAFNLFSIFIHNTLTLRILLLSVFAIIYLSIILFNKNLNSRIYYSLFALFIFSPIVHPWYVTWLIVPLVLKPKLSGITYISLISITFYSVLNYQINGQWKEYTSILFIEYIPVIIILFFEIALKFKQIQIRNF